MCRRASGQPFSRMSGKSGMSNTSGLNGTPVNSRPFMSNGELDGDGFFCISLRDGCGAATIPMPDRFWELEYRTCTGHVR